MSIVRFATLCDRCGLRSPEYKAWPSCSACLDDLCDECGPWNPFQIDEDNTIICRRCKEEDEKENV